MCCSFSICKGKFTRFSPCLMGFRCRRSFCDKLTKNVLFISVDGHEGGVVEVDSVGFVVDQISKAVFG